MNRSDLERLIAEITISRDFSRRLPETSWQSEFGVARAINNLLAEVESRDKCLKSHLDDLVDARDDAQTANVLLRRVREDLQAKTVQLDGALQKAAGASSAKSQFLANMSHEIRTPMNGILGMAELLKRSALNDKQRQQVTTIVHSGRALLKIINDILDFSKIESGKFDLDPRPFDLKLCVSDIAELLRLAARAKSIDIQLKCSDELPKSYVGDAGRIRQIVMNLAGNAVKFTDQGTVTIALSGCVDGDLASLSIDVTDTGIGIPADRLADVFEKFNQVDGTCSRRYEGTGLGLSISQLLAQCMDGDISAESEVGKGSTFTFRLKLPVHHAVRVAAVERAASPALRVAVAGPPDEAAVVQSALAPIVGSVLAVMRANDYAAADVIVLCDVATTDGLVRHIAKLRTVNGIQTPIVVHVTSGVQGDAKAVYDAGAQGYLCGTFDAAGAKKIIDRVLSTSAGRAAGALGRPPAPLVTRHSIAEDDESPTPLGPDTAAAADGERIYKVLVVDDSLVNQEVAKEFLEDMACDVSVAANGVEALQTIQKSCFDLILMDCQMPLMDGFAATAAIRSSQYDATRRDVPIIALTANAFASDRERCLASGMSDFLSKPFLPAEIEAIVQKWLPVKNGHATHVR